jgi:hypothetical protein
MLSRKNRNGDGLFLIPMWPWQCSLLLLQPLKTWLPLRAHTGSIVHPLEDRPIEKLLELGSGPCGQVPPGSSVPEHEMTWATCGTFPLAPGLLGPWRARFSKRQGPEWEPSWITHKDQNGRFWDVEKDYESGT